MIKKGVIIFSLLFLTSVIVFSFGVSAIGPTCTSVGWPESGLPCNIGSCVAGSGSVNYLEGAMARNLDFYCGDGPLFGNSNCGGYCGPSLGPLFGDESIVGVCYVNGKFAWFCNEGEGGGGLYCFDSDGYGMPWEPGENSLIGTSSYYQGGYRQDQLAGSKTYDSCWDTNTIKERFCAFDGGDDSFYTCALGCNPGSGSGAYCNPDTICTDTDGGNFIMIPGAVTYNGGTYKDLCYTSSVISENYCSGGVRVSGAQGCPSGYSCVQNSNNEGYCAQNPSCSDSDGGINYNVQGTATTQTSSYTDYCYGPPESLFLREYYCSGTSLGDTSYLCPNGCTGGKCDSAPPFCSDTDGGNNSWVKGTVSTESGNYVDFCDQEINPGVRLIENFCTPEETRTTQNYDCDLGCFDGACSKLYFGDAYGVELTDYTSKNIGDIVYGYARSIASLQGGFVDGKFQGDYTLTIKEYDPLLPDDVIRENVLITSHSQLNGYGFGWLINQEDVDICTAGEMEGPDCEFYFELVDTYRGITYDSRETSPLLLVPVEPPTTLPQRYWADYGDLNHQITSAMWQGGYPPSIPVGLVMLNFTGVDPMFTITESNGFNSLPIGTVYGTVSDINNDGVDDAYAYWAIDQNVIDMVYPEFDDWPLEFFFDIEGGSSGVLTLTYPQGVCNNNGICEPELGETPENCADCQAVQCAGINLCQDYLNADMCNNDTCEVAWQTPPPAGQGQTDACAWDTFKEPSCYKVIYSTTSNGNFIGLCNSEQNSTSDECIGGFLSYSWTSTWVWAENNTFGSEGECEAYSPDCVGNCNLDGTSEPSVWHCDPNGAEALCVDGSARIPCPAQIQLDFFDLRNVIVAVLLILILYVIFYKVKKSRRASKGKKRK